MDEPQQRSDHLHHLAWFINFDHMFDKAILGTRTYDGTVADHPVFTQSSLRVGLAVARNSSFCHERYLVSQATHPREQSY